MREINVNHISKKIENKRVLVAVSGGADSMALLSLMLNLQKDINFYMEVIHINHNLRGVESDDDERLVVAFCKDKKIPCVVRSVDVITNKNKNKQTLEQAARNLRYMEINKYKELNKFDFVIIAHNNDDNAETILMHICRGSGLRGATGIKENDKILRPLLDYSKEEIVEYVNQNKIPFREDSSNKDTRYVRNFIRHEILPKLEEIYPNVKENLSRFAEIARLDDEFVNENVDYNVIKKQNNLIKLHISVFDQKEPIINRIIYKVINELNIFADIEHKHLKLIKELSNMKNGNYICLPHNLNVYREYDYLVFTLKDIKHEKTDYCLYKVGETKFNGFSINICEVSSDEVEFGDGNLYFDLDSIPNDSVFRAKKDGDVIHKLNSGTKNFSDYLTDKKVPLRSRNNITVLAHEDKVLLALGLDISDDIKITSSTNRIGKLSLKNF